MPARPLYSELDRQLKAGNAHFVIEELLTTSRTGVKKKYSQDLNHAYYLLGCAYFNAFRFHQARAAFKQALSERPDDSDALMALGNCYSKLGMHKAAQYMFRRAVLAHPAPKAKAGIIFNLANALFDQHKYGAAIQIYQKIDRRQRQVWQSAKKNMRLARKRQSGFHAPKDPQILIG